LFSLYKKTIGEFMSKKLKKIIIAKVAKKTVKKAA